MVLVREQVLHIANLGDCRAVLCRNGKAKQLSVDHSPLVRACVCCRSYLLCTPPPALTLSAPCLVSVCLQSERERIEVAGGWVTVEKELCLNKLHTVHTSERACP